VFLSGVISSGREGFYQQVFERGLEPPLDIRNTCNVTFHCSPAVSETAPGVYHIPSVTATASFRFAKYIPLLLERYGVRAVRGDPAHRGDLIAGLSPLRHPATRLVRAPR
jgi:L(+)-tartrate dehydratase beta subunit